MTRIKPIALLAGALVVPLTALAITAGGTVVSGSTASASAATPPTATGGVAVSSRQRPTVTTRASRLGRILVSSQGRTLYMLTADSVRKSTCFGACTNFWPPLRASGKPTAGSGARASLLGTIHRSDGKPQVTYKGHPVYRFSGDSKPGDTNGEGVTAFGGRWFALSAAGNRVSPLPSSSGGGPSY